MVTQGQTVLVLNIKNESEMGKNVVFLVGNLDRFNPLHCFLVVMYCDLTDSHKKKKTIATKRERK